MKYDVIIVGSGPGGCSAGIELAKRGVKVAMLEKSRHPRHKPCAGWVTLEAMEALNLDPAKMGVHGEEIRGGVLWLNDKPLITDYGRTMGWGFQRDKFDAHLVELCCDAGAELIEDCPVNGAKVENNKTIVTSKDGRDFEAQIVIGAGGTLCPVTRSLGLRKNWPPDEMAVAMVSETEIAPTLIERMVASSPSSKRGHIEFMFFPEAQGYGWYHIKGNRLTVGAGMRRSRVSRGLTPRSLMSDLLAFLKRKGRIINGVELNPFDAAQYATFKGPTGKTYTARALVVGDAAGFSMTSSGEGIRPAIISGQAAARTAYLALEKGDFSGETLGAYEVMWKASLKSEYIRGKFFIGVLEIPNITVPFFERIMKVDKYRRMLFFDPLFCAVRPGESRAEMLKSMPAFFWHAARSLI